MPKVRENARTRLHSCVSEFGSSVFSIAKSVLFCKLCEVELGAEKRFTVVPTPRCLKSILGQLTEPISRKKKRKKKVSQQLLEFNAPVTSF